MARAVWLEVALNGAWGKRRQPLSPTATDEIVDDVLHAGVQHLAPEEVGVEARGADDPVAPCLAKQLLVGGVERGG